MTTKANILLVGSGGVGTMSAYNMEIGGLAAMTAALGFSCDAVTKNSFTISSIDYEREIRSSKEDNSYDEHDQDVKA